MHHQSLSLRCIRAVLTIVLLGAGAHALALDSARPAPLNVVIVDQTERGEKRAVLYRLGIATRASNFNKGAHAQALRQILGEEHPEGRLAIPTACPNAGTHDACANVRRIPDVDLPGVIAETKDSTLLIVWPEAAYFPQEELYLAYLDVDVLKNGKVVPGTFYVGYRDWECDVDCVPSAFQASAKELAAMVRYMLDLGPAAQSKSSPADWRSKPVVTSVGKWANTCATRYNKDRVVREYGQRFWLNDPSNRTLTSTAWVGCNIFAAAPR
jgi:hypothetical protein